MTLDLDAKNTPDARYTRIASRVFPELNNFEVAWVLFEYQGADLGPLTYPSGIARK